MSDDLDERLAGVLSELFGESVDVHVLEQSTLGETSILLVEMAYTRSDRDIDHSSSRQRVSQTAVVLRESDLDLPRFELSPSVSHWMTKLTSMFGDIGFIRFDDSPHFDRQYRLHGWNEPAVRMLFTPDIRTYFAAKDGWSVTGKEGCLVSFQHNTLIDKDSHASFVSDSIAALRLFQAGEAVLDEHPALRRDTSAADVVETGQRMTGVVGAMYRRQLEAIGCTREELDEFAQAHAPRKIPSGVHRQVIGNLWPLIIAGALFTAVGLVVGGITVWKSQGNEAVIGWLFLLSFPLIGILMMVLPIRYRRKKARLLREGILAEGQVIQVRRQDNQSHHDVDYQFELDGQTKQQTDQVVGLIADQARGMRQVDQPIRVLVDPLNYDHALCLDLLVVFDS